MTNRYLLKIAEESKTQPHQDRVLNRLGDHKGLIVAHSMGSGKTLTALKAIAQAQKDHPDKKVLAIVPAPLVSNMLDQAKEHGVELDHSRLTVTSYDKAVNNVESHMKDEHSLVVMDEAHKLRNKDTKRSAQLDQVLKKAHQTMFLTGTPIYNKPHDVAVLINKAVGSKVLPDSQKEFEDRYIGQRKVEPGFFAKNVLGVTAGSTPYLKNTTELKGILKKHMDVFNAQTENPVDFPTQEHRTIKVDMDKTQHHMYNYLEGDMPAPLRWKVRMGLPLDKKESANLNAFSSGVRQASNSIHPFMQNVPDDYATPKVKKMADNFVDRMKNTPNFKGMAYSNYLEAGLKPYQKELAKRGVKSEIFDGSLNQKQKDEMRDRYNRGETQSLLVSTSGAEGLNLKGTKMVQIMEPHFNKSKIDQVVARAIRYKSHEHLPEHERHVIVEHYHSTLPPSMTDKFTGGRSKAIDEYLHDMSEEKQHIQRGMMELVKAASEVSMNKYLVKIASMNKSADLIHLMQNPDLIHHALQAARTVSAPSMTGLHANHMVHSLGVGATMLASKRVAQLGKFGDLGKSPFLKKISTLSGATPKIEGTAGHIGNLAI